ncbi:MAG TPA: hypothetical protein VHH36_00650 [Candidatus Thermoplasmatota archaeon]|nr:hypothetical protein [Candidatus Thermoplasmatota archaeon]
MATPASSPVIQQAARTVEASVVDSSNEVSGGLSILFIVGGVSLIAFPKFEDPRVAWAILVLGVALCVAGIALVFYRLRLKTKEDALGTISLDNATHAIAQLSKNYDVLRRQATQGFVLSGVFMAAGFLVILAGSAGVWLGFNTEVNTIATVAGIVMEFVSGTALLLYRMNFNRLNETTDKLDRAWRILTAHQVSKTLAGNEGSQATMKLIDALLRERDR